jgi:hypothetical protein
MILENLVIMQNGNINFSKSRNNKFDLMGHGNNNNETNNNKQNSNTFNNKNIHKGIENPFNQINEMDKIKFKSINYNNNENPSSLTNDKKNNNNIIINSNSNINSNNNSNIINNIKIDNNIKINNNNNKNSDNNNQSEIKNNSYLLNNINFNINNENKQINNESIYINKNSIPTILMDKQKPNGNKTHCHYLNQSNNLTVNRFTQINKSHQINKKIILKNFENYNKSNSKLSQNKDKNSNLNEIQIKSNLQIKDFKDSKAYYEGNINTHNKNKKGKNIQLIKMNYEYENIKYKDYYNKKNDSKEVLKSTNDNNVSKDVMDVNKLKEPTSNSKKRMSDIIDMNDINIEKVKIDMGKNENEKVSKNQNVLENENPTNRQKSHVNNNAIINYDKKNNLIFEKS